MNQVRRKELYALIRALNGVQFNDNIDDYINMLDSVKYDEEYAYSSIPENLQYSYRATASEEAIAHMEAALDSLNDAQNSENEDDFQDNIEDAIAAIEDAAAV